MKTQAGCLAFALMLCSAASGQPTGGTWELSLSGAAGSIGGTSEWSGTYGSGSSDQDAQSFLTLLFRPGLYIVDGLSIEPEFHWTAIEDAPPALSLSGNLAYTFRAPASTVAPFVLVGYGVANTVPVLDRALFRLSKDMDISVLNVGAGLKLFLSESVAMRVEYRYQTYRQENTDSYGPFTETYKQTYRLHNVFFGFSVFL